MVADLTLDTTPAESFLVHAGKDHQEAGDDYRGRCRNRRGGR
jgi:hypothetical protein